MAYVLLEAAAFPACAARPFNTDDARVVDEGHCQLEAFTKSQSAYAGSEAWFLPACNPFGVELTLGRNRIEGQYNTIVQGKILLKELKSNAAGYAFSLGSFGGDPYVNAIASRSFLDDRAVVHANLGAIANGDAERGTWGVGVEALLAAPRWYGIVESFGQRGDKPTAHFGLRFWLIPNRFQLDATHGHQSANPEKRFNSIGIRLLF
jgi:hypothetical protein